MQGRCKRYRDRYKDIGSIKARMITGHYQCKIIKFYRHDIKSKNQKTEFAASRAKMHAHRNLDQKRQKLCYKGRQKV